MAEEAAEIQANELEIQEEAQEEQQEQQEDAGPTIEDLAIEMGWKPPTDYDGDAEDFVDAAEFIRRGGDMQKTMRDVLKEQKRQIAGLRDSIGSVKKHFEKTSAAQKAVYEKELEKLKAEKREAIETGDVEQVEEIEQKMSDISEKTRDLDKKEPEPVPADVQEWKTANPWYGKDAELTRYVDAQAGRPEYDGLSFQKVAELVTKKAREVFPEKFEKPKKQTTPDPVSGGTRGRAAVRFTERDLSSEERESMNRFVKLGIMTKKDYLADIAKQRG